MRKRSKGVQLTLAEVGVTSKKVAMESNKGKRCKEEGCKRKAKVKGFCTYHYYYHRRNEVISHDSPNKCACPDCHIIVFSRSLCYNHYQKLMRRPSDIHSMPVHVFWKDIGVAGGSPVVFNDDGTVRNHHFPNALQRKQRNHGHLPCKHRGCEKRWVADGFCQQHWSPKAVEDAKCKKFEDLCQQTEEVPPVEPEPLTPVGNIMHKIRRFLGHIKETCTRKGTNECKCSRSSNSSPDSNNTCC